MTSASQANQRILQKQILLASSKQLYTGIYFIQRGLVDYGLAQDNEKLLCEVVCGIQNYHRRSKSYHRP